MSENPAEVEEIFRVVLLNEFEEGEDALEVRSRVAARFELSDQAAAHVFAGRPVVVSACAVGNTSLGEVIRGEFDSDLVTPEDADVVLAHLP